MDYQPPVNQGMPNSADYQNMGGQGGMPNGMGPMMEHHSSHKVWYVVGAVVLIVIAGALWYLYGGQAMPSNTQTPAAAIEETQGTGLSAGNTTTDILSDLNQTLNDSNGLEQAAASSAAAVQGF